MTRLAAASAILLLLGSGACRAPTATRTGPAATPEAAARAEPGSRLVCEDETPTGSHIPVRRCYRVLDEVRRDHARDAIIDELNKPSAQMKRGG